MQCSAAYAELVFAKPRPRLSRNIRGWLVHRNFRSDWPAWMISAGESDGILALFLARLAQR